MNKSTIKKISLFFVVVLILGTGGFFWLQENQKDIIELNKNLPKGVRVEKSLLGNEYKVKNKLDGYKFKVPKEWRGIEEISYIPERTEIKYTGTSLEFGGKEGMGRIVSIDRFKIQESDVNLEKWAESFLKDFNLIVNLDKDKIKEFEIIKTKERIGIIGYIYFFKEDSVIFTITGGSEDFIKEIITNGQW